MRTRQISAVTVQVPFSQFPNRPVHVLVTFYYSKGKARTFFRALHDVRRIQLISGVCHSLYDAGKVGFVPSVLGVGFYAFRINTRPVGG